MAGKASRQSASAMPKAPSSKKTPAPSPYEDPKKKAAPEPTEPIWEKKPKNFSIGGDIQPRRELGRYVKWPAYVRIQRQRKILYQRLKVPPSINQFSNSLDKNLSVNLFKLLHKYKPEGKQEKKERIAAAAEAKAGGEGEEAKKKPLYVKYGLNHITKLCEDKKAQLVVIAHDVDPIELVIWLPAVCRKVDIPYCIVKSKSRLGSIVGKKTATAVALTSVRPEDRHEFSQLVTAIRQQYNENAKQIERTWGGGIQGTKSQAATAKLERQIEKEKAKKALM